MDNTPYLYDTLLDVLGQHSKWLDFRHRQTLAWMMMGLIGSKTVSLGAWAPVLSWGLVTFQDTRESSFFKSLLSAYLADIHQPPVTSEY
jgi:hypothetical protein